MLQAEDSKLALRVAVDKTAEECNAHLMRLLMDKYHFHAHSSALKRYLLLAQGDFIQLLFDRISPELHKPASGLLRHNLQSVVAHALRDSNAQYDDPTMLDRISVRLLKATEGDTGWEIFSLDYLLDSPLNTVFTPEDIKEYLRVFNFLWRLKRVAQVLPHATPRCRSWPAFSRPLVLSSLTLQALNDTWKHHMSSIFKTPLQAELNVVQWTDSRPHDAPRYRR